MDNKTHYDSIPITVLTNINHPDFRSNGERQMARLFYARDIPFFYEETVFVERWGEIHGWQPDFILPSFNCLLVEYAGVQGDSDYDEQLQNKIRTYHREKIPLVVIPAIDFEWRKWGDDVLFELIKGAKKAGRDRYLAWEEQKTNLEGTLWGTGRFVKSWFEF